jgi:O-antigen/teichoic acid export membrane protein
MMDLSAWASPVRYLRLRAFPPDSEEGRIAERYRLAVLGAISTGIARLVGVALIALSVSWAAPALGRERFGVWATFSSFTVMLSFLDLGVGNALVNRVAQASTSEDARLLPTVIMGGIFWLSTIGIAAAIVLAVVGASVPWLDLFRLTSLAIADETRTAALIFSGLFALDILARGLLKIMAAQQRTYEAQMVSSGAAALACPAVWWTAQHSPTIGALLLAGFGTQSFVTIAAIFWILHARSTLNFALAFSGMLHERKALLTSGTFFLFLQIGTMIGWGADSFLLAWIVGASGVAAFAVVQRLFLFASQPVSILNGPLWAAYADAHARGDHRFIREALARSFALSMAISIAVSIVLLLFGKPIVAFWTADSISVPWALLAAFALWTPLESAGSVLSVYLNGSGIVREQLVVVLCFCLIALPVKILAALHSGAVGLVVATTVSYALVAGGMYGGLYRKRILRSIGT